MSLRRIAGGVAVVLALLSAGCGNEPPGAGAAEETARSYLEAYNDRDGEAMCDVSTAELRAWFEHAGAQDRYRCGITASALIGYGEEADTPTFQRLVVLSARPHVTGDEARVDVRARYRYKAYPKPVTRAFTDAIYLVARDGRWEVAKPGGVYFATRSAYSPPSSALDPPVTDTEAHDPAPRPPARFACVAKTVLAADDPAADAPDPLDVSWAGVTVNADRSICMRVRFAKTPHPGTEVNLRVEQDIPGETSFFVLEPTVRIGSRGRLFFSIAHSGQRDFSRLLSAGWKGDELRLLWRSQPGVREGGRLLGFGGDTRTLQFWEPFVRNPETGPGDDPSDSGGDRFGTT